MRFRKCFNVSPGHDAGVYGESRIVDRDLSQGQKTQLSCGARSSEVQFMQTSAPVTQIRSTPPSCSAGTHFGGFRKIFGM